MTTRTFDEALASYVKATSLSMIAATECSRLAITQFETDGDLGYCQRFHDAMPKNYARRVAFIKWLMAFSPVAYAGGKLTKDKAADAAKFDLEGAFKEDFWNYAPEIEVIEYMADDVILALQNVLKKFDGNRYSAKNDAAALKVAAAKTLVANLKTIETAGPPPNTALVSPFEPHAAA